METISFENWEKADLRIGKIKEVGDHPKADKLYILIVSLGKGEHEVQLVAGLKGYYKKDELIGKQVLFIRNLKPRTIRGIESQGMVLAAVFKDKLSVLIPDREIETGAKIQ